MNERTLAIDGIRVPRFFYGTAWKEDRTQQLTELALEHGFRWERDVGCAQEQDVKRLHSSVSLPFLPFPCFSFERRLLPSCRNHSGVSFSVFFPLSRFSSARRPLAADVVAAKLLAEFTNLLFRLDVRLGLSLVGESLSRTGPLWTGQCRLTRLRFEGRRLQHPLAELPSKSTGDAREPHFPGRCHCLNPIDNPSSSPSCSAQC